ncbi:MAG: acetyl-CoA C-acyltransferase [Acidimicrobiia bacterium]
MRPAYILDAVRTPFGKRGGGLSGLRTDDLAALPIAALVARQPRLDPATIEDVVLGNTNGAGEDNRNVGRMAALLAGLPVTVPGATVNRLCGSGAEALVQAARAIAIDDAQLIVAGGVESMSRAPFVVARPDAAFPRSLELVDSTVGWRFVNPGFPAEWTNSLGGVVETVATEYGIERDAQDAWALRSHRAASAAWASGAFEQNVVPAGGLARDESIRDDASLSALAKLPSAFSSDGTVTAGNSSPINDGAAAALIGSAHAVERFGIDPIGAIMASSVVGTAPDRFPVAPVEAIRNVAKRVAVPLEQFDLIEINEAFAAMVLCTLQDLPELERERVNVNGGAIAMGHPLGASAVRIVIDLCVELRRRGGGRGIAAACIGVGQGIAIACEVDP